MINKTKYRSEFETALGEFINDLKKYVSTESGDWSIKGFIDIYKNNIYYFI